MIRNSSQNSKFLRKEKYYNLLIHGLFPGQNLNRIFKVFARIKDFEKILKVFRMSNF